MIKNEINVSITDAQVTAAIAGLNAARAACAAVLIASLTPSQRKKLFKMGKDSLQFVQEDFNFAQDPDLKANEIDNTIWENDITAASQLLRIFDVLQPLYDDLSDMLMMTGNEAMEQAQYNYRFLRYKAGQGLPEASAAYERLRSLRWERPPQAKKAQATPV